MAAKQKDPRMSKKEEERKNNLLLENLLSVLDCPICFRRTEPENLIQCRNGHCGCKNCFRRLEICPLCRVQMDPEIQTFSQQALEQIPIELRHLESHDDQLCHKTVAKIFKCMECNITTTKAPVFQCQKGHVYCYRCPGSGRFCTPCKRMYGAELYSRNFTIRNQAVQDILCCVKKLCRFSNYGCSARIFGFTQHEDNCEYSENYCVIPLCIVRVPLPKLLTHILADCELATKILKANDPSKFRASGFGCITIPMIPREKLFDWSGHNFGQVNILKLAEDRYFLFSCYPDIVISNILFYTFFIGVPKEAKKFSYTLKLSHNKNEPLVERRAAVISSCSGKFSLHSHPDVFKISFSDIHEMLKIITPFVTFVYGVEVFENEQK